MVTTYVIQRMLNNNHEIIQLVHGSAIYIVRIRQTDPEVRNRTVYSSAILNGKIPWKNYCEIPKKVLLQHG